MSYTFLDGKVYLLYDTYTYSIHHIPHCRNTQDSGLANEIGLQILLYLEKHPYDLIQNCSKINLIYHSCKL